MADDTDAGLPVRQQLKMAASGDLSLAEFKKLKIFPKIQEMTTELTKYNSLINSIKPLPQRLDAKGNDTFTLLNFWRANEAGRGAGLRVRAPRRARQRPQLDPAGARLLRAQ